jgi:hypothetical protein
MEVKLHAPAAFTSGKELPDSIVQEAECTQTRSARADKQKISVPAGYRIPLV